MIRFLNFFFLLIILPFYGVTQEVIFTQEEKIWIKNHPVIEFGYEPDWAPYEIFENGEYQGIVGEYVQIIEEKTGIDMVPIKNISWEESLLGLKNGNIKIVPCCAITPERKKFLEFTDTYIDDPIVIVTRTDYEFISDLNDLSNKIVAIPKSYYTGELISANYPKIILSEKKGIRECLEDLSYGKADAFVGNLGVISYYINHKGFTNLKIAAPTPFENNGIALAVTKDWTIFRNIAQKVFKNIPNKKKMQIRQDWISVRYEHGFSWEKAIYWVSIGIIIFLVIISFFIIWNRTLKKQIHLRKESEMNLVSSLSKIKKQNKEKEFLLQEIHHRVKNNLQIISSLIRLQQNTTQNENVIASLAQAEERIRAISMVHEKIYSSSNLGEITIVEYVESLANEVIKSATDKKINIHVSSEILNINLKSIVPLALILNELLTNTIKYGFLNKEMGTITIDFKYDDNLVMRYFDNGLWVENNKSDSFGTSLIETFTEQLDGDFILNKTAEGTEYIFTFNYINK